MRKQCENKTKEARNLINMCQNVGHCLSSRERKILKDYGLMGRVVALRNIVRWKKTIDVLFVFIS